MQRIQRLQTQWHPIMHVTEEPDDPPPSCRTLFPFLEQCTYLDTGSAGVAFTGMGAAAAAFYDDAKSSGYLGREQWQARAANVRNALSRMLGVSVDEIEFRAGTTDALNQVAYAIDWQPGDEVVFAADDFPSVRVAWQAAERFGAVLKPVSVTQETQRNETLIAAIGPRTRVVAVSHVHSFTGTKVDLDRIGRACRSHESLFVVDGIHALGATGVTLDHVDVYASGVFKWMLAGFGLSVLVLRPRARQQMRPAFRGYLNEGDTAAFPFAHANYPGLYVLDSAVDMLGGTFGWEAIHRRTRALVQWLADDLATIGLELAAPEGARAGLATFTVDDSETLHRALAARGIHVAPKGPHRLRATPFFYNSREDVAHLARALADLGVGRSRQ